MWAGLSVPVNGDVSPQNETLVRRRVVQASG